MAYRVDGLEVLKQRLGSVAHAHAEHPFVVPGSLDGEQPDHRPQRPVHANTARRIPRPTPAASHFSRGVRPELRKAPFTAAASADPMATNVRATSIWRSSCTASFTADAITMPSPVRVKARSASLSSPPYWSRRIALLSPAESAA